MMKRLAGLGLNLLVAIGSLGFVLLLLEGVVRTFHLVPVNDYRRIVDTSAFWRLKPHTAMVEDQPEFKVTIGINGAGYRDREFMLERNPGRARIALIGDSFTFGTGVRQGERTSELLEASLRAAGHDCEVYNFGKPGLDTFGAVAVLEHGAAPYRPDLALLMLYLGNDITDNVRRAALASIGTPAPGEALRPSYKSRVVQWVRARSQLYQFVIIRVAAIPALGAMYNRMKAANMVGEVVDQLEILGVKNSAEARLWGPTRDALGGFTASAAALGIRPVVVLLPSRLQYDDRVWSQLLESRHLDAAAYSRSLPNHLLGEYVTRDLRTGLIDPLLAFQVPGADAGETYYPINGHFTAKGHALLARDLALQLDPVLRELSTTAAARATAEPGDRPRRRAVN